MAEAPEALSAIFEALGGGRFINPETYMADVRGMTPEVRGKSLQQLYLTSLLGDQYAPRTIMRFTNAERDLAEPGEQPYDLGITTEQQSRLRGLSLDAMLNLVRVLGFAMGQKGYTDFQTVRASFGATVMPTAISMMEVLGVHDLGVFIKDPVGTVDRRSLRYTAADFLGETAYKPRMLDLFAAKDQDSFPGLVLRVQREHISRQLGINLNSPAGLARFVGTEMLSFNGNAITRYDQLEELLMGLSFGGEGFSNLMMDALEFAQYTEGGMSQEHARSEHGSLYYQLYGLCDVQMTPWLNLTSLFPGLISRYAGSGGLDWMIHSGGITGPKEEDDKGPSEKVRSRHIKEIFTFEPKEGGADIAEARMFQRFIGGENITPDQIRARSAEFSVLPVKHLRPIEQWGIVVEQIPVAERGVWNDPGVVAEMNSWAHKIGVTLVGTSGYDRLVDFIKKATVKGVSIMDWNNFNSRVVSDIVRYGEKVAKTSAALNEASMHLTGMGGTLTPTELSRYGKAKQLTLLSQAATIGVNHALEAIVNVGPSDFMAFTDKGFTNRFMYFWARGVIQANKVPRFSDNETQMVDLDYKEFIRSEGTKMRANTIRRKDIEKMIVNPARIAELDALVENSRCRWSVDRDGNKFLIGSSGRPLYLVATAKEMYDNFGRALHQIEASIPASGRERIEMLVHRHEAIVRNGHNRMSINWMMGKVPLGKWLLSGSGQSFLESFENKELLPPQFKDALVREIEREAEGGNNTIGPSKRGLRDHVMAPPEAMRPWQYKLETVHV